MEENQSPEYTEPATVTQAIVSVLRPQELQDEVDLLPSSREGLETYTILQSSETYVEGPQPVMAEAFTDPMEKSMEILETVEIGNTEVSTTTLLESANPDEPDPQSLASRQNLQARIIKPDQKKKWAETLETKTYIVCTVPGCHMKYSTIYSFERHYKWCTGDKGMGVENCPYCDNQFLATDDGILTHVLEAHADQVEDYQVKRGERLAAAITRLVIGEEAERQAAKLAMKEKQPKKGQQGADKKGGSERTPGHKKKKKEKGIGKAGETPSPKGRRVEHSGVIAPSRNWSAPRRTYSRSPFSPGAQQRDGRSHSTDAETENDSERSQNYTDTDQTASDRLQLKVRGGNCTTIGSSFLPNSVLKSMGIQSEEEENEEDVDNNLERRNRVEQEEEEEEEEEDDEEEEEPDEEPAEEKQMNGGEAVPRQSEQLRPQGTSIETQTEEFDDENNMAANQDNRASDLKPVLDLANQLVSHNSGLLEDQEKKKRRVIFVVQSKQGAPVNIVPGGKKVTVLKAILKDGSILTGKDNLGQPIRAVFKRAHPEGESSHSDNSMSSPEMKRTKLVLKATPIVPPECLPPVASEQTVVSAPTVVSTPVVVSNPTGNAFGNDSVLVTGNAVLRSDEIPIMPAEITLSENNVVTSTTPVEDGIDPDPATYVPSIPAGIFSSSGVRVPTAREALEAEASNVPDIFVVRGRGSRRGYGERRGFRVRGTRGGIAATSHSGGYVIRSGGRPRGRGRGRIKTIPPDDYDGTGSVPRPPGRPPGRVYRPSGRPVGRPPLRGRVLPVQQPSNLNEPSRNVEGSSVVIQSELTATPAVSAPAAVQEADESPDAFMKEIEEHLQVDENEIAKNPLKEQSCFYQENETVENEVEVMTTGIEVAAEEIISLSEETAEETSKPSLSEDSLSKEQDLPSVVNEDVLQPTKELRAKESVPVSETPKQVEENNQGDDSVKNKDVPRETARTDHAQVCKDSKENPSSEGHADKTEVSKGLASEESDAQREAQERYTVEQEFRAIQAELDAGLTKNTATTVTRKSKISSETEAEMQKTSSPVKGMQRRIKDNEPSRAQTKAVPPKKNEVSDPAPLQVIVYKEAEDDGQDLRKAVKLRSPFKGQQQEDKQDKAKKESTITEVLNPEVKKTSKDAAVKEKDIEKSSRNLRTREENKEVLDDKKRTPQKKGLPVKENTSTPKKQLEEKLKDKVASTNVLDISKEKAESVASKEPKDSQDAGKPTPESVGVKPRRSLRMRVDGSNSPQTELDDPLNKVEDLSLNKDDKDKLVSKPETKPAYSGESVSLKRRMLRRHQEDSENEVSPVTLEPDKIKEPVSETKSVDITEHNASVCEEAMDVDKSEFVLPVRTRKSLQVEASENVKVSTSNDVTEKEQALLVRTRKSLQTETKPNKSDSAKSELDKGSVVSSPLRTRKNQVESKTNTPDIDKSTVEKENVIRTRKSLQTEDKPGTSVGNKSDSSKEPVVITRKGPQSETIRSTPGESSPSLVGKDDTPLNTNSTDTPVIVKRGRGRPPKKKIVDESKTGDSPNVPSVSKATEETAPKNEVLAATPKENVQAQIELTPGKRRGRPTEILKSVSQGAGSSPSRPVESESSPETSLVRRRSRQADLVAPKEQPVVVDQTSETAVAKRRGRQEDDSKSEVPDTEDAPAEGYESPAAKRRGRVSAEVPKPVEKAPVSKENTAEKAPVQTLVPKRRGRPPADASKSVEPVTVPKEIISTEDITSTDTSQKDVVSSKDENSVAVPKETPGSEKRKIELADAATADEQTRAAKDVVAEGSPISLEASVGKRRGRPAAQPATANSERNVPVENSVPVQTPVVRRRGRPPKKRVEFIQQSPEQSSSATTSLQQSKADAESSTSDASSPNKPVAKKFISELEEIAAEIESYTLVPEDIPPGTPLKGARTIVGKSPPKRLPARLLAPKATIPDSLRHVVVAKHVASIYTHKVSSVDVMKSPVTASKTTLVIEKPVAAADDSDLSSSETTLTLGKESSVEVPLSITTPESPSSPKDALSVLPSVENSSTLNSTIENVSVTVENESAVDETVANEESPLSFETPVHNRETAAENSSLNVPASTNSPDAMEVDGDFLTEELAVLQASSSKGTVAVERTNNENTDSVLKETPVPRTSAPRIVVPALSQVNPSALNSQLHTPRPVVPVPVLPSQPIPDNFQLRSDAPLRKRKRRVDQSESTINLYRHNCENSYPKKDLEEDEEEDDEDSDYEEPKHQVVYRHVSPGRGRGRGSSRFMSRIFPHWSGRQSRKSKGFFKCSGCNVVYEVYAQARNHILSAHNGLANINDDSPIPQNQVYARLKAALRIKKVLICHKDNCGKTFRSLIGYINHAKECGVETQYAACDVCGKKVRAAGLALHRRRHMAQERELQRLMGNTDPSVDPTVHSAPATDNCPPRRRKAAIAAKTRMQEFVRETNDEGLEDIADDGEQSDPNDKAYVGAKSDEEADYKSDNNTDEDVEEADDLHGEKSFMKKLRALESMFQYPSKPGVLDKETNDLWTKELTVTGKIMCKLEGCGQEFTSNMAMLYHWQRCQVSNLWTCRRCPGPTTQKTGYAMYRHLVNEHSQEFPEGLSFRKTSSSTTPKPKAYRSSITGRDFAISPTKPVTSLNIPHQALKFCQMHYVREVFPNWRPRKKHWRKVTELKHEYPLPFEQSVPFRIEMDGSPSTNAQSLKLYESTILRDQVEHLTINVGGPVWSSAWCPTPYYRRAMQYIALGVGLDPDKDHLISDTSPHKGILQLWRIGHISRNSINGRPRLMLSLAHEFGMVWDLVWCPSGAWDDPCLEPINPNVMSRLGLLAVACGDGSARIISLPHPNEANRSELYQAFPLVVLTPPDEGSSVTAWRASCTAVSWQRTGGHATLLAGYGNGCICQFDLMSRSPLLVMSNFPIMMRPFMMFTAHSSAVTSLTFAPFGESRFFASSGLDRDTCIWDLHDTSTPLHMKRRGVVRDLAWTCHWCGYFGAQDECYNLNQAHTFYKECGYYNYSKRPLSSHGACTWSISVSEWLNLEASCDSAGEVVMMGLPEFQHSLDLIKGLINSRMPVYRIELEPIPKEGEEIDCLQLPPEVHTNSKSATSLDLDLTDEPGLSELRSPDWHSVVEQGEPGPDGQCDAMSDSGVCDGQRTESGDAEDSPTQDSKKKEAAFLKDLACCKTYAEITSKYRLVIKEAPVGHLHKSSRESMRRLAIPQTMNHLVPGQYMLASVNTVCWNPNPGSHWWLFSAGQAGLARLSCISTMSQPVFEKELETLQTIRKAT